MVNNRAGNGAYTILKNYLTFPQSMHFSNLIYIKVKINVLIMNYSVLCYDNPTGYVLEFNAGYLPDEIGYCYWTFDNNQPFSFGGYYLITKYTNGYLWSSNAAGIQ